MNAVEDRTKRVDSLVKTFEQTAKDFSVAAVAIDQTAQDISKLLEGDGVNNILIQAEKSLKAAENTMAEYTLLASDGRALSDDARRIIEQFSTTGLQDLSLAMGDLKTLIETLNRVSEDLERSPVEFIVGQKKELTELPQ